MARKAKAHKAVSVDKKAGSLAYNRIDMQVSQCLHMAIELYPDVNYLLVLDHYDDITVFDDDSLPTTVSFYQMKTSEDSISIDTAISQDWIAKLYEQLSCSDWFVKELGLITNSPLKVIVKLKDSNGHLHQEEKSYSSERTPFTAFNPAVVDKIKHDIAKRKNILEDDVDLSKFAHMRTTLSIPRHREIVEQELASFLYVQYPKITIESAKTIFASMMDLLSRRQSCERLDKDAGFTEVRRNKGVSKSDFSRIIENAMYIAVPEFSEIERLMQYSEDEKMKASYEYTKIMSDVKGNSESFSALFLQIKNLCRQYPRNQDEKVQDYCERINELLINKSPIYGRIYISILIACMLINEWRRTA